MIHYELWDSKNNNWVSRYYTQSGKLRPGELLDKVRIIKRIPNKNISYKKNDAWVEQYTQKPKVLQHTM